MSFSPKSLDALSQNVRAAFRQYMPGTDAAVAQNTIYVIAKVQALLAREYELRLKWIYDQLFLSTASVGTIIKLHSAEFGVYQKSASPSSGIIKGEGTPNKTYPAGVRFISGAQTYVSKSAFTANALGAFQATVQCEQSGLVTNREAGAALNAADTGLYPEFGSTVLVDTTGLGGGADKETIEELRQRALKRKRNGPKGGALADYERWALEVPGVVNAWAENFADNAGAVGAWVLFKGRTNGIATPSDLKTVETYIEDLRIVRGRFYAVTPAAKSVDLSIALTPDTENQRAAVYARLVAFFDATQSGSRIRPGLPEKPFTLPRAWISEVISQTVGEDVHTLITPSDDLVFQPGELAVLGNVTWI